MEVSVLQDIKRPTPDAKYWQAQKEQKAMFRELVFLSFEYRKNMLEIRQLEERLKEQTGADAELTQVELDKKRFIALEQEQVAKDRAREIKEWHEIKERLKKDMKFSLEDCDEHQLASYTLRFIEQAKCIPANASPSEIINLKGLLVTSLRLCREKGILNKILLHFPKEEARELMESYAK